MNIGNHHAYVIEGISREIFIELKKRISEIYNVPSDGNPDIIEYHFPNFLVEHSRFIKEVDIKSPFFLPKKTIIISFDSITREAQNALLKVLEDPSPTSQFFIITNSAEVLLPTVLSRVEVVRHKSFGKKESLINAEVFLKASRAKRLEMVSLLLKQITDEEVSREEVLNFLKSLKAKIEEDVVNGKEDVGKLKTVLNTITFAHDKSASLKLLLERVSLC